MENKLKVAPSSHPVKDETKLIDYIKKIQDAGADFAHLDIMDGNFVEEKTFSYETVKEINDCCLIPLDVHLMVTNPEKKVAGFIESGANIVTVHFESFQNLSKAKFCLKQIHKLKALCGISFKPQTETKEIFDLLPLCNLVLVMSVEPGKSGQKFILNALSKIKELVQFRKDNNLSFLIEVDGGVNSENAILVKDCGADIVVSGSYLYNSNDLKTAIDSLR